MVARDVLVLKNRSIFVGGSNEIGARERGRPLAQSVYGTAGEVASGGCWARRMRCTAPKEGVVGGCLVFGDLVFDLSFNGVFLFGMVGVPLSRYWYGRCSFFSLLYVGGVLFAPHFRHPSLEPDGFVHQAPSRCQRRMFSGWHLARQH